MLQESGQHNGREQAVMGGTLAQDRIIGILEEAEDEEESSSKKEALGRS